MLWAFWYQVKPWPSVCGVCPTRSSFHPTWRQCHLLCCPQMFQLIKNVLQKACIRMREATIIFVSQSASSWCFYNQMGGCHESFILNWTSQVWSSCGYSFKMPFFPFFSDLKAYLRERFVSKGRKVSFSKSHLNKTKNFLTARFKRWGPGSR